MKTAATATFGWITTAVTTAWNAIRTATTVVWGAIRAILTAVWSGILAVARTYFNAYVTVIRTTWNVVQTVTSAVWNAIRAMLVAVWGALRSAAVTAWNAIGTAIMTPMRLARDGLAAIWLAVRTVATTAWALLRTLAVTAWTGIQTAILTPLRAARDAISGIWHSIGTRAAEAWENIKGGVGAFASSVRDMVEGAFRGIANKVIDFVNAIFGVIRKIPGVDDDKLKDIKHLKEGGEHKAQGLARGGAYKKTGGFINRPMTFMGEEAPRHPEYVIPTNPAYRSRAQGLLAQAAGAIGFQEGGVISAFRSAIDSTNAGPKASLALWMAGIVESGLRNLTRGLGTSTGPLQLLASTAQGMGLNARDSLGVAKAFLTRGFTGRGGAISLAAAHPNATAGQIAQMVQGSAYPDKYDQVRAQAEQYWKGQGRGTGGGGILGAIGGAIGHVGGVMGKLLTEGAGWLLGKLPGVEMLPEFLQGTGKWVLSQVRDWISDKVASLVGSFGGGGGGGGNLGGDIKRGDSLEDMVKAMNKIHAKGFPYVYAGGHASFPNGPYDCSGLVSAIMYAGGLLNHSMDTTGFKGWGMPGPGKQVTIGVRGSSGRQAHMMVQLGNRYAESGSGHGARWVSGWSGSFPIKRHPGGFAEGGLFGDPWFKMPPKEGWGLATGGKFSAPYVGAYANGGVVPRDGFGYLHAGETVVPGGSGGPLMNVETMIVNQPVDFERELNSLAFKMEMGAWRN
jgi:hypothetical protein